MGGKGLYREKFMRSKGGKGPRNPDMALPFASRGLTSKKKSMITTEGEMSIEEGEGTGDGVA